MERHQLAVGASVCTRNEDGAPGGVVTQTQAALHENTTTQSAAGEASFASAGLSAWTHTLILTGELDRGSVHVLEGEIERLCEEGVTGITLDLRELEHIDSIGVAVIAFRCGLCRRRGHEFALIPGSRSVQRAFEQAGVAELLPFRAAEIAAPSRRSPARARPSRSNEGVRLGSV
jgi:anti-sigma B factor antagonist